MYSFIVISILALSAVEGLNVRPASNPGIFCTESNGAQICSVECSNYGIFSSDGCNECRCLTSSMRYCKQKACLPTNYPALPNPYPTLPGVYPTLPNVGYPSYPTYPKYPIYPKYPETTQLPNFVPQYPETTPREKCSVVRIDQNIFLKICSAPAPIYAPKPNLYPMNNNPSYNPTKQPYEFYTKPSYIPTIRAANNPLDLSNYDVNVQPYDEETTQWPMIRSLSGQPNSILGSDWDNGPENNPPNYPYFRKTRDFPPMWTPY